jgi:mRNA interferase RelE/StbE
VAWTIEYARSVRKSVEKLDAPTRRRIRAYIEDRIAVAEDPRALGKALTGPLGGLWRYRVGDHRVICDIQDDRRAVLVLAIGHRRDVYR